MTAANGDLLDVLVVGAGPTGLTLAAQLQAFGATVRIVDRQLDRVHESRALGVQPRTLEVLRGLGLAEELIEPMKPLQYYIENPKVLPEKEAPRWFILNCIRQLVKDNRLHDLPPATINRFLAGLSDENQLTLLADMVDRWGALGADKAMFALLKKVTNI